MRQAGKNKPDFVTWGVKYARKYYVVNIDIVDTGDSFTWESIATSPGDLSYDELVSGFIRIKYSDDSMTAIINNYLLDPTDEEHLEEFNTMQDWRKESKRIAKEAIQYAIEEGIYEPTVETIEKLHLTEGEERPEE